MDQLAPILIAEDDENDILILERALRNAGFSNPFHVSPNGIDVIQYLCGEGRYTDREKFPFPRILITDLKMPGMDGMQLLRWLKEHPTCNTIPRVVLSASRQQQDIEEAYRAGANSYLVKPDSFQRLAQMFRLFLDYWQMCELPKLPPKC